MKSYARFDLGTIRLTFVRKSGTIVLYYGQTNEKYKEKSRKSSTAGRKPITYSRASNFGSQNEMCIYLDYAVI